MHPGAHGWNDDHYHGRLKVRASFSGTWRPPNVSLCDRTFATLRRAQPQPGHSLPILPKSPEAGRFIVCSRQVPSCALSFLFWVVMSLLVRVLSFGFQQEGFSTSRQVYLQCSLFPHHSPVFSPYSAVMRVPKPQSDDFSSSEHPVKRTGMLASLCL